MSRTRIINAGVVLLLAVVAIWVAVSLLRDDEGSTDGPVIAHKDWNGYPDALVVGTLHLDGGCLMVDDGVVFWPSGTSWDAEEQAVVFGGDFGDAPDAKVGDHFEGGGAYYESNRDHSTLGEVAGERAGDAVTRCLEKTMAQKAIAAHPEYDS